MGWWVEGVEGASNVARCAAHAGKRPHLQGRVHKRTHPLQSVDAHVHASTGPEHPTFLPKSASVMSGSRNQPTLRTSPQSWNTPAPPTITPGLYLREVPAHARVRHGL